MRLSSSTNVFELALACSTGCGIEFFAMYRSFSIITCSRKNLAAVNFNDPDFYWFVAGP